MDGTGLAPVPDKVKGHLGHALNASCPVIRAISSQHCRPFHLLCATVAAPLPIKEARSIHQKDSALRNQAAPIASSRAQEHSIHPPSRTRVLRILAVRTWVNDPCADY